MSEQESNHKLSSKPIGSDEWQSHEDVWKHVDNGEFSEIEDAVLAAKRIAEAREDTPETYVDYAPPRYEYETNTDESPKEYDKPFQYIVSAFDIYAKDDKDMRIDYQSSIDNMQTKLGNIDVHGPVEPKDLVLTYQPTFSDEQQQRIDEIIENITHDELPPDGVRSITEMARQLGLDAHHITDALDDIGKSRLLSLDPDTGYYWTRNSGHRMTFHYGKINQAEIIALYDARRVSPYLRTKYMQKKYAEKIQNDADRIAIREEEFPGYAKSREYFKLVEDSPHDVALKGMRIAFKKNKEQS